MQRPWHGEEMDFFFFFKTPKSSSAEAKRNGLVEAAEKFQIQVTLLRKQLGVRES